MIPFPCSGLHGLRLVLAAMAVLLSSVALAQNYPVRPVRFIVPFPPGGGTDVPARLIAPRLAEGLNQQMVVDNRAGANGILGTDAAAKAAPDGYTILIVPSGHTINPSLYKKLPFDTAKDLASISLIANGAYMLVANNALPVKTVADLIAMARAKPGAMLYGSGGVGNGNHLAGELLNIRAGIKLEHVPYKGGGPLMNDLLGGHIAVMFAAVGTLAPQVRSGKMRALGVSTATRSLAFPDVPTLAEAGVTGYELNGWYALLAPAGTPAVIIDRLSRETARVVALPEVKDRLINGLGLEPVGGKPAELDVLIRAELRKWDELIRTLGITADAM